MKRVLCLLCVIAIFVCTTPAFATMDGNFVMMWNGESQDVESNITLISNRMKLVQSIYGRLLLEINLTVNDTATSGGTMRFNDIEPGLSSKQAHETVVKAIGDGKWTWTYTADNSVIATMPTNTPCTIYIGMDMKNAKQYLYSEWTEDDIPKSGEVVEKSLKEASEYNADRYLEQFQWFGDFISGSTWSDKIEIESIKLKYDKSFTKSNPVIEFADGKVLAGVDIGLNDLNAVIPTLLLCVYDKHNILVAAEAVTIENEGTITAELENIKFSDGMYAIAMLLNDFEKGLPFEATVTREYTD